MANKLKILMHKKNNNNIANIRYRVLSPHTSVCIHLAYKPHTWQSGCSQKSDAQIIGQLIAMMQADLRG